MDSDRSLCMRTCDHEILSSDKEFAGIIEDLKKRTQK